MSENEPKDWAQYEAQGVPVLDFFLALYDDRWLPEEMRLRWEQQMDFMAEVWLSHHPNGPYRESEEASFAKLRAQSEATNWSNRPRFGQTGSVVEAGVPVCGHKSSEDIYGKAHTCTQSKGHEAGGIPHEDETHKWFTRDTKPFLKRA